MRRLVPTVVGAGLCPRPRPRATTEGRPYTAFPELGVARLVGCQGFEMVEPDLGGITGDAFVR